MSYINLALTTKLTRLGVLNNAIGGNAVITVYDSVHPTSPELPAVGNALVTFPCDPTAFGSVAATYVVIGNTVSNSAVLTSNSFPPQLATTNGIAAWARITSATGNAVVDVDVGLSNASVLINETTLIAGVPVQVVSITIKEQ